MGTKIHKGLWLECKVCPHTEEELKAKREKRERPSFKRKRLSAATADIAVRRQVAYELGGPDAEPTSEQKFQMLQKYGVAAARIDRAITKPSWMGERQWRLLKQEFYIATKGLVPKEQFKRNRVATAENRQNRPLPQGRMNRPRQPWEGKMFPNSQQRNSSGSRPNFAQGPTGNRPR